MDQGKIPNIESTLWPQATPKKCFISHPPTSEKRKAIGRKMFHVPKNKFLKKKNSKGPFLFEFLIEPSFLLMDTLLSTQLTYFWY